MPACPVTAEGREFAHPNRPDVPLDLALATKFRATPDGPAKRAAYARAGFEVSPRAYLGRTADSASQLVLRDAKGRQRLIFRVEADGAARIQFLDAYGKPVRTIAADVS